MGRTTKDARLAAALGTVGALALGSLVVPAGAAGAATEAKVAEVAARVDGASLPWQAAGRGRLSSQSFAAIADPTGDNPDGFDPRGDLTAVSAAYSVDTVSMGATVRQHESLLSRSWVENANGILWAIDVNTDDRADFLVVVVTSFEGEPISVVIDSTGAERCAATPSEDAATASYAATFAASCIGSPAAFRWAALMGYETDTTESEDIAPNDGELGGGVTSAPICAAPQPTAQPAVALRRGGVWYLKDSLSGGNADSCLRFGDPGDQPVFGDWDGDGVRTPGVFRAGTGTWYLSDSIDASVVDRVIALGSPGDLAVVGDFNDDGVAGIGVFRPSNGTFYLSNRLSSGPAEGAVLFGSPGDVPLVGDWNDDGTDTPGVFRPSTGTWFLTNRFDNRVDGAFGFGQAGDLPVVGDWNRDGTDTLGLFRPATGSWLLTNFFDRGTAEGGFAFGQRGDHPLVRA